MTKIQLNTYSLIHIHGKDVIKFLQGQLTCDVDKLTDENVTLGAHCNAKGRIISLFRLFNQADDYYLLMPNDVIEAAFEHLKKYAMFSKVSLEIVNTDTVTTFPFNFDATNQHQADVNAGIPQLYPQTIGQFLPHYLNLPKLGGVSFTKGCYTGQEIIARMEHRGKLKQGLKTVMLSFEPVLGEKVIDQEQNLGVCVDYCFEGDGVYKALVVGKI